MDFLAKIGKALGIEDATEEKVLDALEGSVSLADVATALELDDSAELTDSDKLVEAVKAKFAETPASEKSLEDRAKEEGKVVLDQKALAELTLNATRGKAAADELHQSKFDTAFGKALDDVRVDAKDETRERYQKLYDVSPETTLELLENLPKLANTEARGSGKQPATAPDGVDADSYELDQAVNAYMAEHKVDDYAKALHAVIADRERQAA